MYDDPNPAVNWDSPTPGTESKRKHNTKSERMQTLNEETVSVTSSTAGGQKNDLLYQREVLDAIFHHIPIGVVLMNAWGLINGFSKGAERMFMFSIAEVVGENVRVIMPASVAERHDYYLSRARQRITTKLATMLHVLEATIALDNLLFDSPDAAQRVGSEVLRMAMFGGQKREVLALDKAGSTFPAEVMVSPVILVDEVYYLGYLVDLRDLTLFQDLTVKQELLLRSILDSRIMSRLLAGEHIINDVFDYASIAHIELCDYTDKAISLEDDQQRADYLREVFAVLDRMVEQTSITKIKTFGSCYLVACGVPLARDDHPTHLFKACGAILQAIVAFNEQVVGSRKLKDKRKKNRDHSATDGFLIHVLPIEIRIGLHMGPVIGGFYSTIKGEYDLYGAAYLKAAGLMRTCRPQAVHLSAEAYGMLPPEAADKCHIRRDGGIPYTYECTAADWMADLNPDGTPIH